MSALLGRLNIFLLMPWSAVWIFAGCVGSLLTALIAQHFFDVAPCILCIYQRIPYAASAAIALLALLYRGNALVAKRLLMFASLLFLINAFIAFYHSGVELQWWKGTDSCGIDPAALVDAGVSVSAAREALLRTPTVRCDEINFTFIGFTMANWNVLASLGFAVFAFLAAFFSGKTDLSSKPAAHS